MQYFKTAVLRRKAEQNGLVVYASAAIIKRKEPIIRIPLLATGYRLCVLASGSYYSINDFCYQNILLKFNAKILP